MRIALTGSIYQNLYHLLMVEKNLGVPVEIRRCFPWICWLLWKNRNNIIFKGDRFLANDTAVNILEDVLQWNQAQ